MNKIIGLSLPLVLLAAVSARAQGVYLGKGQWLGVSSTAENTVTIGAPGSAMSLSSTGFTTSGPVHFSSNVVIAGDLEVRSSRQKAIFLPRGGIHLDDSTGGASPPGLLSAKNIKTSTITIVGSAILFRDTTSGVVRATMTATNLTIDGVSAGKLRNSFKGNNPPAVADCDEPGEDGLQYFSKSPSRLYICVDEGGGVFSWRYTNLSP